MDIVVGERKFAVDGTGVRGNMLGCLLICKMDSFPPGVYE